MNWAAILKNPWQIVGALALLAMGAVVSEVARRLTALWMRRRLRIVLDGEPVGEPQEEPKPDPDPEVSLLDHPLFGTMRNMVRSKIPTLPIAKPMRRAVFRDLLKIKFSVWCERAADWARAIEADPDVDLATYEEMTYRFIDQSVAAYSALTLAEGIPPIAVELFNLKHQAAVAHMLDYVHDVCRCPLYETNRERAAVIMTGLESALHWTLVDAGKALTELNGQLDGVSYKGYLDHCRDGLKCAHCVNPEHQTFVSGGAK